MDQVRLCALWPVENCLVSSLNQIQGWITVRESYPRALEQGPLTCVAGICVAGFKPPFFVVRYLRPHAVETHVALPIVGIHAEFPELVTVTLWGHTNMTAPHVTYRNKLIWFLLSAYWGPPHPMRTSYKYGPFPRCSGLQM